MKRWKFRRVPMKIHGIYQSNGVALMKQLTLQLIEVVCTTAERRKKNMNRVVLGIIISCVGLLHKIFHEPKHFSCGTEALVMVQLLKTPRKDLLLYLYVFFWMYHGIWYLILRRKTYRKLYFNLCWSMNLQSIAKWCAFRFRKLKWEQYKITIQSTSLW